MFGAIAALELLPMIANAEATYTSLESAASHADCSSPSRRTRSFYLLASYQSKPLIESCALTGCTLPVTEVFSQS
jgi:hypothetical protein